MSDIKLKPCPFCGKHLIQFSSSIWLHNEYDCFLDGLAIKEDRFEAWNTRKPMERIVERLEELLEQEILSENVVSDVGTGLSMAIAIVEGGAE